VLCEPREQFWLFRIRSLIANQRSISMHPCGAFPDPSDSSSLAALCPSSAERQLGVDQIGGTLIQIKQEFRWGRSLSTGARGRALARRIAAPVSGRSAV
jgi:hypothetical protein